MTRVRAARERTAEPREGGSVESRPGVVLELRTAAATEQQRADEARALECHWCGAWMAPWFVLRTPVRVRAFCSRGCLAAWEQPAEPADRKCPAL